MTRLSNISLCPSPCYSQPLEIDQIKPGGRIVIPVGQSFGFQDLMLVEKADDGQVSMKNVLGVSFVPFRGEH